MTERVQRILVTTTCVMALAMHVPGPAGAQETLTLEDAIARGLKHSARLAELQARQEGSAAVQAGRAAAKLPIVAAQAGYTRTNHVDPYVIISPGQGLQTLYPDVPNNYRTRLDLQWPIYTAGRSGALERAARAETQASAEDLAAARADLVLEITRAYWALVTARETELVLGGALRSIDAHVSDLKTRLDQGLISPNDLLSAQAQRSRERVASIEAGAMRQTAEADLRRLIGGDGPIQPASIGPDQGASASLVPVPRPERRALNQR
ncbi:MAG TPA: TolC family protein, partial [Vicinamibacterales bacterium]|nr:TolC family protein [Vicinamibacterales bacterium]